MGGAGLSGLFVLHPCQRAPATRLHPHDLPAAMQVPTTRLRPARVVSHGPAPSCYKRSVTWQAKSPSSPCRLPARHVGLEWQNIPCFQVKTKKTNQHKSRGFVSAPVSVAVPHAASSRSRAAELGVGAGPALRPVAGLCRQLWPSQLLLNLAVLFWAEPRSSRQRLAPRGCPWRRRAGWEASVPLSSRFCLKPFVCPAYYFCLMG